MYSSTKYNWLILLVSLGACTTAANLFAQAREVCHDNPADALSAAVLYHHRGSGEIIKTRGMPRFDMDEVTGGFQDFEELVSSYLSAVPASAFMLYAEDTERICVFLWRSDEFGFRYGRVGSTGEELSKLSELLVRSRILTGSEQRSRLPKRRGLTPITKPSETADPRTTPALVQALSGIIFPERLRHALNGIRSLSVAPIRNMSSVPMAILQPFGDSRQVVDLFSVNFVAFLTDLQKGVAPLRSAYTKSLIIRESTSRHRPGMDLPESSRR